MSPSKFVKYVNWAIILVIFAAVVNGKKEFHVWRQVSVFLTDHFSFSQEFVQKNKYNSKRVLLDPEAVKEREKQIKKYKKRIEKLPDEKYGTYVLLTKVSHSIRAMIFYPVFKISQYSGVKVDLIFGFIVVGLLFLFSLIFQELVEGIFEKPLLGAFSIPFLAVSFFMNGRLVLAWLGVLCLFYMSNKLIKNEKVSVLYLLGGLLLTSVSSGVLISCYFWMATLFLYCRIKSLKNWFYPLAYVFAQSIPLGASLGKVYIYHERSGHFVEDLLSHGLGRYSSFMIFVLIALGTLIYLLKKFGISWCLKYENQLFMISPIFFLVFGLFGVSTFISGLPIYAFTLLFLGKKYLFQSELKTLGHVSAS